MKNIFKIYLFPIFITAISFLLGYLFNDILWGGLQLAFGFLNAYYMAIGKWYNYIYGILFSIVYAYVCYVNGLYGLVIFTIIFYTPIQISGLIGWIKNKGTTEVAMRSLNFKSAFLLCSSLIIGSIILGYLLSLIPTQNLAFLDGTSQIINLSGVLLASLRFRESWYIWLFNNIIDTTIWVINTINHTPNAEMSLITSIMYFVMNIIGVILWIKLERKQKNDNSNQIVAEQNSNI